MKNDPMTVGDLVRRAVTKIREGDLAAAHALLASAVEIDPSSYEALACLGGVLSMTSRRDEALAVCDRMLALKPRDPDALYNRGLLLLETDRLTDAVAAFDAALDARKSFASALSGRASALARLDRHAEALTDLEAARKMDPNNPRISNNHAVVLNELGRHVDALAIIDELVARAPQYADAQSTRGTILFSLRRDDEAVKAFERALALRPEFPDALNNLAQALRRLGSLTEAIDALTKALRLRPDFVEALCNRGSIAEQMMLQDEAIAFYERALELRRDLGEALTRLAFCCLATNDWSRFDSLEARLREHPESIDPYTLVMFGWPQHQQYELIGRFAGERFPTRETAHHHHPVRQRIKIAYISSDFREHPIAQLTAGLFEHHDKERFEIVGISLGPDDRSDIRRRIVDAFDEFHDVRDLADDAVVELIRSKEIDIAVDLNGYTAMARTGILAARCAPIQVNYLGQPGTM
ncbi:MAG TPA: tetratricopeptide repeat protein, partial [Polyangiales bacterium]|nr:tetratricopeptide repeat protein [Polyangiales bacterium]